MSISETLPPFERARRWNEENPIGTVCMYWPGARRGLGKIGPTRSEAESRINGHASVFLEGQAGYVALTHVSPLSEELQKIDPTQRRALLDALLDMEVEERVVSFRSNDSIIFEVKGCDHQVEYNIKLKRVRHLMGNPEGWEYILCLHAALREQQKREGE